MSTNAASLQRVSPSALLCTAAGISAAHTTVASVDTACGMCGIAIQRGEGCVDIRHRFDDSFNNRYDLVEGRKLVCRHCSAVWTGSFWMSAGAVAYTAGDEVVKLWSKDDVVRFLLDPPRPPFIAFRKFAKQQHVVWRSPVNWDRSRIFLRLGDEILSIRLERVHAAVQAWHALKSKLESLGFKGPIAVTDGTLASPSMGCVTSDATVAALHVGMASELEALQALSAGEWWAIDALKGRNANDPLPPRRVLARADGWREAKVADDGGAET